MRDQLAMTIITFRIEAGELVARCQGGGRGQCLIDLLPSIPVVGLIHAQTPP